MKDSEQEKIKTYGRDRVVKNGNVLMTDEDGLLPVDEGTMVTHGSLPNPHDG